MLAVKTRDPEGAPDPSPVSRAAPRLQAIIDAHYATGWRFLRRLGFPESDVDDVMQEVILIVARRLDVIDVGSERGFLLSTALRVARAMRRAGLRRGERDAALAPMFEPPSPNLEEAEEQRRARELLDRMLEEMPLEPRVVFVLYEIEEMTLSEISAALELPQGTVASRLRRARALFEASVRRYESQTRWKERR